MPVLPLVASISASPGLIVPRFSARTIIDIAGRSLTDPAGLLPSSLARTMLEVFPGRRFSLTRGVCPAPYLFLFLGSSQTIGKKGRDTPLWWGESPQITKA